MEKKRASALHKVEELLAATRPYATVAFVGPAARTWREDIAQIRQLVELVSYFEARIASTGTLPFDLHVEEAADELGANLQYYGPPTFAERLSLPGRDHNVLMGVDLVIAFPLPKMEVMTADPKLVEEALTAGIPVLAVLRDGSTMLIDSANYLYV